jgi:GNAT superfamily N-acetyltransferase
MVRERLADALEVDPGLLAVGLWHGFTLCGVAAWRRPDADGVSFSPLVATRTGHSRRGYARILKEQVVKAARDAGAIVVVSTVHWDNEAMMQLNIDLGAWLDPIPGDDEYCRCIIPIGDPLPLPAALDDEPF